MPDGPEQRGQADGKEEQMADQTQPAPVHVRVTVDVPIEHAFSVFTGQCDRWWPPTYRLSRGTGSPVLIEPHIGGRWYEAPSDGPECDWGKVLEWDPPRRVTLSWQITPEFGPQTDEQQASRVEVRFEREGPNRTTVTLVHSEIERHGDGCEAMLKAVSSAWPGIMETYAKVAAAPSSSYWLDARRPSRN
jgi:uncharacterized protein YndB with AHSA1/START domain